LGNLPLIRRTICKWGIVTLDANHAQLAPVYGADSAGALSLPLSSEPSANGEWEVAQDTESNPGGDVKP